MPEIRLSATARVIVSTPDHFLKRLTDYFSEHGDVSLAARKGRIALPFGTATIEADDDSLSLRTEGEDETGLAYMKYAIANQMLELANGEKPRIVWAGDCAAGGQPPFFREMRFASARNISPQMRRVTLQGERLARFARGGLHVHLLFPPKSTDRPQWPVTGEDGRPVWPEGAHKLVSRIYTIRNIDADAGKVDIDIVLHEGNATPGSDWALNARQGDLVGMTGPGGGDVPEADWYLLAGDETALPAIGRILARLPSRATAVVRIEVDNPLEEQLLPSGANVDLVWLHRNGRKAGTTTLLQDAVKAVPFPTAGKRVFAWAGCEFAAFKAIRSYLRHERKLERERHLVVAYWRRGFDGDNARKQQEKTAE
ncbi:siderophore-interacting protein [Phyllobacterium chamaecytisi]|uniref:siderophore-interacting protein n=1 Tax=Phyllobacterium chamaecytisi TaxID=2876082 RepID=UPI001CCB3D1C|nr:siderophore-interacting protein [Phyllobacterium sp. KW56]MBZ9603408.1 siderophore-interacting protein [Phyllobacterium sp. KW56]